MGRPLDRLQQIADVVEAQARTERAQVPRGDPEGRLHAPILPLLRKSESQALVDNFLERLARAPNLRLEPGRHVLVEAQGGAHILMLQTTNHDVSGNLAILVEEEAH